MAIVKRVKLVQKRTVPCLNTHAAMANVYNWTNTVIKWMTAATAATNHDFAQVRIRLISTYFFSQFFFSFCSNNCIGVYFSSCLFFCEAWQCGSEHVIRVKFEIFTQIARSSHRCWNFVHIEIVGWIFFVSITCLYIYIQAYVNFFPHANSDIH